MKFKVQVHPFVVEGGGAVRVRISVLEELGQKQPSWPESARTAHAVVRGMPNMLIPPRNAPRSRFEIPTCRTTWGENPVDTAWSASCQCYGRRRRGASRRAPRGGWGTSSPISSAMGSDALDSSSSRSDATVTGCKRFCSRERSPRRASGQREAAWAARRSVSATFELSESSRLGSTAGPFGVLLIEATATKGTSRRLGGGGRHRPLGAAAE